jgi:hypothetical protein
LLEFSLYFPVSNSNKAVEVLGVKEIKMSDK